MSTPANGPVMSEAGDVKEVVREKHGQAALRVKAGQGGCCGSAPGCCAR